MHGEIVAKQSSIIFCFDQQQQKKSSTKWRVRRRAESGPQHFLAAFFKYLTPKISAAPFYCAADLLFLVITQKIRQNFRPSPFGESWISQWWEIIHAHSSFLEHTNPLINKLKVLSKLMTSMNCKQQYLCVSIIKKKFFPQNFLTIHALLIRTLLNNLIFLLAQKSLRHHRP